MANRWLAWINFTLIGLICLCVLAFLAIQMDLNHPDLKPIPAVSKQTELSQGSFAMKPEAYEGMENTLLYAKTIVPTMQLPDLRPHLLFYGKNGRPDAQKLETVLHFSINANKAITSVRPGEILYLVYDKASSSRYQFSPNNQETSLYIEPVLADNEVLVKVFMKNEKGEIIKEPSQHAQFKLPEKEAVKTPTANWELGTWRVDGTLLARQRARWFGTDCFLERQGGDEYKNLTGKQRLDFGEGEETYSIFASLGDCFIWDKNRWKSVPLGEETLPHSLLVIKKVDDRLMSLELWHPDGKGKMTLNLLKSTEPWIAQNTQTIENMFKFVGARTRTQCVFEISGERMTISPSDWLLLTPEGWIKLASEKEIDDYVERRLTGTLFIFEDLVRKNGQQVIEGLLYNSSRSAFQEIELPILQGGLTKTREEKEKDEDSDEEEDDDEEDSAAQIRSLAPAIKKVAKKVSEID